MGRRQQRLTQKLKYKERPWGAGRKATERIVIVDGKERQIVGRLFVDFTTQKYSSKYKSEYTERLLTAQKELKEGEHALLPLDKGSKMIVAKKNGRLYQIILKGPQ